MNYILGGGGFQSRLMQIVRSEGGLTYGINSGFDYDKYVGSYYISTFTKNESTSEAIDLIMTEIDNFRTNGVTETELSECQSFYSGYFPLQFETPSQIANYVETILLHNLDMDYYTNYLKEINSAKQQDIKAMANKYLDSQNCLILVVGKADDIKDQMAKYGEVEVIPFIEL